MSGALPILSVALVGSVDHGKSTLLGRLIVDTGLVTPARVAQIAESSAKRGVEIEWSFLLDSFQAERDQAVTIDVTQVRVQAGGRDLLFIDAPGHVEFLRNLVTGAASADAVVLLVDATQGSREQTRRHSALLRLLGVADVVVAINKIDLCADPAGDYARLAHEMGDHLRELGLSVRALVPTDARRGTNLLAVSADTPWYEGPSLVDALAAIEPRREAAEAPLRLPVQDVYRTGTARWAVGRLLSGTLELGDTVALSPSGRETTVEAMQPGTRAHAGDNVAIALAGDPFVERGDVVSHATRMPKLTRVFDAEVFWLDASALEAGRALRMRIATRNANVRVQSVQWKLADDGIARVESPSIARFGIGGVTLRAEHAMPLDDFSALPGTARFVLQDGGDVVGIGIADTSGYPDLRLHAPRASRDVVPEPHTLTTPERARRFGHPGAVVWLTGLSGSGKSTLAMELEQRLFAAGCAVYVLDGDNLRRGLNADLGFGPDDRRENIRRAGEAAALFADAGLVCVVALISPYRDDRERARLAAGRHPFVEVFVDAPIDVCAARDPKGLYKRARAGGITGFTGVGAPYERPEAPEVTIDTAGAPVAECADALFRAVSERLGVGK